MAYVCVCFRLIANIKEFQVLSTQGLVPWQVGHMHLPESPDHTLFPTNRPWVWVPSEFLVHCFFFVIHWKVTSYLHKGVKVIDYHAC